MMKHPRQHNAKHLDFIRSQRCCVCLDNTSTEACHVRFSDARVAKINPGVGQKPDDTWTVPLCGRHHREQHGMNEQRFWASHGIDPIFLAMALARSSGDHEAGEQIVACATHKFEAAPLRHVG